MIPKQSGFFGLDKLIGNMETILTEAYRENQEIADNPKLAILAVWKAEGLGRILGDKLKEFSDFFMSASSNETITRCLRSLKENGVIQLTHKKVKERQEREQDWRQYWGNERRSKW